MLGTRSVLFPIFLRYRRHLDIVDTYALSILLPVPPDLKNTVLAMDFAEKCCGGVDLLFLSVNIRFYRPFILADKNVAVVNLEPIESFRVPAADNFKFRTRPFVG